MCDFGLISFGLADKYRIPVIIAADGFIGQMMEPVDFPKPVKVLPEKPWAVKGTAETRLNVISSIELDFDDLERHNIKLQKKYAIIEEEEVRYEEYRTDDAEIILVCYGIASRVVQSTIDNLRAEGVRAGMFRPITLFPFPSKRINQLSDTANHFLSVEMSNGQMYDDIRLSVEGKKPVHLLSRYGGNVPTINEIHAKVIKIMR